jgi:spore coat protein CotF
MRPRGNRIFYKEKTRLNQLNDSVDYMEGMMPTASDAVKAVLQKNIDQSKQQAKNILNQMISEGYTGE